MAPAISLVLCALAPGVSASETLSANQVIQMAVARAQNRSAAVGQPSYVYTKVTVTEELNPAGKVTERQEKVYEVQFQAGSTFLKLIEVNGRPLAAADTKKQAENESKFYRVLGQSKSGKGDRRENFLTAELVSRFDFTLVGQTPINERPAFQLTFRPKNPSPPAQHFVDHVLDRVSGTLWIDAEEFEIARADIRLGSQVDLLGGVLGSLKKMAYTLMRTRLADGQWFNASSSGDFEGRKLLDSTRVKTSSRSTNFRPLALR